MAVKLKTGQRFVHAETLAEHTDIYAVVRSITTDYASRQVRFEYAIYSNRSARESWKMPLSVREYVMSGDDYKDDASRAQCYQYLMARIDTNKYQSDET
jgi:hypothetical protein